MKKVGLITIHRIYNYGSALQTFATARTIEKFGCSCKVIDYTYPNSYHFANAPFYLAEKQSTKISIGRRFQQKLMKWIIRQNHEFLFATFHSFLQKNLSLTKPFETPDSLLKNPPTFDVYITGSDQVWNPLYCGRDLAFLLGFAPDSALKIAYAASFGSHKLMDVYKEFQAKWLYRYDAISVRETSGVQMVKELTGAHAECVVDPTLLLTADEWNNIASEKRFCNKPYILCYILKYSFDPYPYITDLVRHLQRETGYEVLFIGGYPVNVLHPHYTVLPHVSPEEFLSLYRDASFVVTSSFHGTAFALNYAKPFFTVVDDKATTDDRQLGLIRRLGAEDRAIVKGSAFPQKNDIAMDYQVVHKRLAEWRIHSLDFLKESLEIEK
jgi:hypothetical protein